MPEERTQDQSPDTATPNDVKTPRDGERQMRDERRDEENARWWENQGGSGEVH